MTATFFATAPADVVDLAAAELRAIGARQVTARRGGVSFRGDPATALRACLWCRIASRILLELRRFRAADADAVYDNARAILWREYLRADGTFAVTCTASGTTAVPPAFAALRAKDAIADQFRDALGRRPSVSRDRPELRVHVHLDGPRATIALDLGGESLARRGYRLDSTPAPLRENLAAALLLRAGWDRIAAAGGGLCDPMCGSGTLPIEAGLIAGDVAPGLLRGRFGFEGWPEHDAALWSRLCAEAEERRRDGAARIPPIRGFDRDPAAVAAARANATRAGLGEHVRIERSTLGERAKPAGAGERPGLVATNPPYGERSSPRGDLATLYSALGRHLERHHAGWEAAVLVADPACAGAIGQRAHRSHPLRNGPIACRLFRYHVPDGAAPAAAARAPDPGAAMFANRLRKNLRTLGRWAAREGIGCYRLYDADMPEYAVAIDLYASDAVHAFVQEYEAPPDVDRAAAARRLRAVLATLPELLDLPPERIHLRRRRRQRDRAQYERLRETGRLIEVREGPCRLLVNLDDYVDTGLFLDHRPLRALIAALAPGRDFLNLFAYTGAASVHAGLAGARTTLGVDRSGTYVRWGERNLALNGLRPPAHRYVRAECMDWLTAAAARGAGRYGLVYVDPPTFSNSKDGRATFDVQRDHVALLRAAAALLDADGVLLFSNHRRGFRLDRAGLDGLDVEEITDRTVPRDFARRRRVHRSYRIRRAA